MNNYIDFPIDLKIENEDYKLYFSKENLSYIIKRIRKIEGHYYGTFKYTNNIWEDISYDPKLSKNQSDYIVKYLNLLTFA